MVLFPGQVRQLRIFEPRYRALLRDCLADKSPFGLVLARAPAPDGAESLPHTIGATAHITALERMQDGDFGITIRGGERFQLNAFQHDRPYLQGLAEPLPMQETATEQAHGLARRLAALLPAYIDAFTKASGFQVNIPALPAQPEHLAYLTAIILQVGNDEKHALLSCRRLPVLLARELRLLHHELDLMAWISDTVQAANERGVGASGRLNLN
jgi:Lon protease-like protein